jgi:flagellar basal-body rod protein FlgG
MNEALHIAATGLHAQQTHVETIANNLANVNTVGFKRGRVSFLDMLASGADRVAGGEGAPSAGGVRLGAGVAVAAVAKSFEGGDVRKTDSALDIAIAGDGFLPVTLADGARAFFRGGSLGVNRDGMLATQAGFTVAPGIAIPDNAQDLTITADGTVLARVAGQAAPVELGQLELVRFASPAGLHPMGDGLYTGTESSGQAIAGRAGEDGMGSLRQGYLEGSNVKLVEEMVSLMVAQRAYEASAKVVQASDEMLGLVNNLRK